MVHWDAVPLALLGILIVLLPVSVIGLFASKLLPQQRTALLVLYGGAVLLLGVVAADMMALTRDRMAVDLTLLIGGVVVGVLGGAFLPFRFNGTRVTKIH
jgi:hypothetical protein